LNGVFVAIARNTSIAVTSPDGIVWTQRVLPVSADWSVIIRGNGLIVAIARNTSIAVTSPDGIVWTQRVLPVSADWYCGSYGNNTFIIAAHNSSIAATSPDGIVWTQRVLPVSKYWTDIEFGIDRFVMSNYYEQNVLTTTNGIDWTTRVMPHSTVPSHMISWSRVVHGNDFFIVAAGLTGLLQKSTDGGVTWKEHSRPYTGSVGFGDGMFINVSGGLSVATSKTCETAWWVSNTIPITAQSHSWNQPVFGNESFVVISSGNGNTWPISVTNVTANIYIDPTTRITETPALTLPANHSYFVKIT
jgi:hypothetical protein